MKQKTNMTKEQTIKKINEACIKASSLNDLSERIYKIISSAVTKRDKEYEEIFSWLLGQNGDFPDLSQKPHYSFRTKLRKKLSNFKSK